MRMSGRWRLLLVFLMIASVAPLSAERPASSDRRSSECPHARASAEAASTDLAPFLGITRTSVSALMP
jgi:hypothetical protein